MLAFGNRESKRIIHYRTNQMEKKYQTIEDLLINSDWEEADRICSNLSVDELCAIFEKISKQRKVQLFMVIEESLQERVFKKCSSDSKGILLSLLELSVARRLLIRQTTEVQHELFKKIPQGRRKALLSQK